MKREVINFKNEEWRLIPECTRYYASNFGRIKKVSLEGTEEIETIIKPIGSKNKTGKLYLDAYIELASGNKIRARVSRIIAKTFIDSTLGFDFKSDKRVVNHITNQSECNILQNLEICTQSENISNAVYQSGKVVGKSCRKCFAYNINTKELREYPSTGHLCVDIWNSNNKGYFNHAREHKTITKSGWRVGYTKSEAKFAR